MTVRDLALAMGLCFSFMAHAADTPLAAAAAPPEATIESTSYFDVVSTFNHESYRVKVFVPAGKPPAAGYPTLYVLDGNILFGTFEGAVRNEGKTRERGQAIVVGIESGAGETGGDRTFDFTPSDLTAYEKQVVVDLGTNPRFGGYENFLRAIREEIKPRIRRLAPVDSSRDILLGWSLGGQFVLHTMLAHPEAFASYVAISPSLWRNDRALFKEIPAFEKNVTASGQHVSLFIGVGSLEEKLSPAMAQWGLDMEKFAAEVKYARMVGNVQDFTNDVRPFFDKRGMPFYSKVFDDETHNTVPWAAVNPVIRFALPAGETK